MHELSLMENMMEIVREEARSQGSARVHTVVLEVGRLAGVEVDALRFAFDAVAADTVAAGAVLEIEEPGGLGWCPPCQKQIPVDTRFEACPFCGGAPLGLLRGGEMRVKAIEIA
jgi:hydrogenase nickel incorporation protein HypA/HybF